MLSSTSRAILNGVTVGGGGMLRGSTPDLHQRVVSSTTAPTASSSSSSRHCSVGSNGGGGMSLFGGTRALMARKAGKQTAWSPHTGTASQNNNSCSPLEADVLMWSPLPRDQTAEYEEDTGTNISIQREYIGKKSRTDLSIFQNVPLVHSKIELERGKAVIAHAINSKKDPREVIKGDADIEGYTSTDYDPETGSLVSARHEFTQDKVQYCQRFCRGIIPVEAVRHSILQVRNNKGSKTKDVGDLADLGPEELREVMAMANVREAAVLGKFTEDPNGVMDAMIQGGGKKKKQADNNNNTPPTSNSEDGDHVLPPMQAMMEVCAIAASALRGGSAALNTLVRGRTILKRSQGGASGGHGIVEEDATTNHNINPGDRLSGADAAYTPEGRLFGLNATSRGSSVIMGSMDAAMRSDYGAFEAYLDTFGLSTERLELQSEQYHAQLNASLETVEKFNAALRSENHSKNQHQRILVPSTAKDTIRFDDPGTLHYGTIDDEAADAAARSAAASSRTPEEIKFWFSTKNKDEVSHQALTADSIAGRYPNSVVSEVVAENEDGSDATSTSTAPSSVPTVELASLYAAYIKFATGESPLPYYSSDTSKYNHNDGSAAAAQSSTADDADGIRPAITTSTSVDGGESGEAGALLTRRIIAERLHWRKILEKCVLEDFHLLTPQDIDAAKNLNSYIEISKLMDHKVGDVVRSIVQYQRQDGGGGSSGSSHRINAMAPTDMAPGNPASRYADKHTSRK